MWLLGEGGTTIKDSSPNILKQIYLVEQPSSLHGKNTFSLRPQKYPKPKVIKNMYVVAHD
jgi:hypothetical protein